MSVKTTGFELKQFYNDPAFWPDGVWHEDEEVIVDGVIWSDDLNNIPDEALVKVSYGMVFNDTDDEPSFETYFKRWRKTQTTTTFTVTCENSLLEPLKNAIRAVGGKIN